MNSLRKKITANSHLVVVVVVLFVLAEAVTISIPTLLIPQKTAAMTIEFLSLITFFSLLTQ